MPANTVITVPAGFIEMHNSPRIPKYLALHAMTDFYLPDGTPVKATSPHNYGNPFALFELTPREGTSEPTLYDFDELGIFATTNAARNAYGARWGLYILDANKRLMSEVAHLESFHLAATPTTATLLQIANQQSDSLPFPEMGDEHFNRLVLDTSLSVGTTLSVDDLASFSGGVDMLSGGLIAWESANINPPSLTDNEQGVRELYYAGDAPDHLAIGVESGSLWWNVGAANSLKWYFGAAQKHILTKDGLALGAAGLQPSAILQLDSVTRGFLPPRLTTTQRDAMTVQEGLQIWNSTNGRMEVFNGGLWVAMSAETGNVSSVFGRTGAVAAATNDYTWAQINKTVSSLADLATRSASDLNAGTLPEGVFPATLPPLNAHQLENLNAGELLMGTVPTARLGSGTANNTKILRGDNTWQTPASFGLIDGSGVADRLPYWTDSDTLASSPLVRIDGDTTEHRGTGGATLFKVSGGSSSGISNLGASISADPSVIVYGVYKTGLETPIPVRLASVNGGNVQLGSGDVWYEGTASAFQPHTDDAFDLGASDKQWSNAYIHNLHTDSLKDSDGNDVLKVDPMTSSVVVAGVKVYRANLTQAGHDDPTATEMENSLGGSPVWTLDSNGIYLITLTGAFPADKVQVVTSGIQGFITWTRVSGDALQITTQDMTGTPASGLLSDTSISIYVNP